ncbi:MAG: PIG-L family deacetylase [Anaerolineales bacterium]|nr:PIG-L family deacetylase [Anaerolineales bacterium]MCB9127768.1 PIG-L family deacetylase [Ardenticatenales bacterium]
MISAKSLLYQSVLLRWALLLRRCGQRSFTYRPLERWTGGDALLVAPHPDDECLGAAGTLLRHRAQGDRVAVVIVTDGSGSRAVTGERAARAALRRREAECACARLGVDLTWLGWPEAGWQAQPSLAALRERVEKATLLYLPSVVDFHPDHLAVARIVAPWLRADQRVRVYELSVPLTPTLTTLLVDTTEVAATAHDALQCHHSQRGAWQPLVRRMAYRSALHGMAQCEPFWALDGAAYQRMVNAAAWQWQTTPFRGLRPRPFSDGAAYWQGQAARRALWQAASGEA